MIKVRPDGYRWTMFGLTLNIRDMQSKLGYTTLSEIAGDIVNRKDVND